MNHKGKFQRCWQMFDQLPLEIRIKPNININCKFSDQIKQEFSLNDKWVF